MAYRINLTHRGPQVISGFDLFDECHYGADKLFFRGHFCCPSVIEKQIRIALGDDSILDNEKLEEYYGDDVSTDEFKKQKLGIGNPLTITPDDGKLDNVPTIALNRYHIPNKKFWENVVPTDIVNPYKAMCAVRFAIRVFFKEDSVFITFGCPWEFTSKCENLGTLDENSPPDAFFNNMVLFTHRGASKEDALEILSTIFPNISENTSNYEMVRSSVNEINVLEIVDENGNLISA